MRNKGFTLIEVLAVIIILGIILGITTISVISIKEKQDEKNLENIVSLILTGAKEYYVEERVVLTSVDELLNKEKVEFDEEKYEYLITNGKLGREICSNPLKHQYYFEFTDNDNNSFKYTDCGCETQESAVNTICAENK